MWTTTGHQAGTRGICYVPRLCRALLRRLRTLPRLCTRPVFFIRTLQLWIPTRSANSRRLHKKLRHLTSTGGRTLTISSGTTTQCAMNSSSRTCSPAERNQCRLPGCCVWSLAGRCHCVYPPSFFRQFAFHCLDTEVYSGARLCRVKRLCWPISNRIRDTLGLSQVTRPSLSFRLITS